VADSSTVTERFNVLLRLASWVGSGKPSVTVGAGDRDGDSYAPHRPLYSVGTAALSRPSHTFPYVLALDEQSVCCLALQEAAFMGSHDRVRTPAL